MHQLPFPNVDRRHFLRTAGAGFGAVAMRAILARQAMADNRVADAESHGTVILGQPHHPPRAKSVIFLFMSGGPSQLDTFDRKPLLNKLAGQPLPASFKEPILAMGEKGTSLLASRRKWKRYGESGLEISDWFPHVAQHADRLAVIRSCYGEGINHAGGCNLMNTSSILGGRPSMGAWVSYGLGTENENLPSFVVMRDTETDAVNGVRSWGSGFLPATFQGTAVAGTKPDQPIANLQLPAGVDEQRAMRRLELIKRVNQMHASRLPDVDALEARIRSYELAYRMQSSAP
ncbi:MAG: DUF1501 domain-containing protein, partial [Planctomycetota bacterium]